MADQQGRGADPGKVIDRLCLQIANMVKENAVAMSVIEDVEAENAVLKQQAAAQGKA